MTASRSDRIRIEMWTGTVLLGPVPVQPIQPTPEYARPTRVGRCCFWRDALSGRFYRISKATRGPLASLQKHWLWDPGKRESKGASPNPARMQKDDFGAGLAYFSSTPASRIARDYSDAYFNNSILMDFVYAGVAIRPI